MIELKNLSKQFETLDGSVDALRNINLTIRDGDVYGIIGMSGAGKSTLVRCINMLERPTEGSVLVNGKDMSAMSQKELRTMRRKITMIFQGFNLLMQRTCLNNIMLPLRLGGADKKTAEAKARELLELVDLPDKANSYPAQLSGGQQQRVAIARALVTELIRDINKKLGITVIVITHQMSVVQEVCNRVAILENGEVVEEGGVAEVFSNPRANATRNLIYPESADGGSVFPEGGQRIRVIFNGAVASREPLIAKMAIDCGIMASILGASTRSVGDRAYGYMLLDIPGSPEELAKAISYLSATPDITVQVEAEYAAKEVEA